MIDKRKINCPKNTELNTIDSQIRKVNTALPVKVIKVNASNKTINAQILIQLQDQTGKAIDYAPLHNIPYTRSQAGGYGIICDPMVGDIGLVVFCSRDISNVIKTKTKALPASNRAYNIADGIYMGSMLLNDPEINITLTKDHVEVNGDLRVNGDIIATGEIRATGDIVAGDISLKNHIHTNGNNGGNTGKPVG